MENRTRNRILFVLFVGVLMGALDIAIVGPALPALQADFGVGERSLAWVLAIYVLFNLIGTPLMAKLSDRVGRRSIYMLDILLFGIGSLIVALSPSFTVLLVGRAVQGFGVGGIFPIAAAVIGDTFPPDRRGRALGLIGAVFGMAFIIGPILGGILLQFSWHWLFYINVPVAIGIIIAASRILPAAHRLETKPFDWVGLVVLTGILGSLSLGLNQLGGATFKLWPLLLLILGMGLLSIFGAVEMKAADPIFRFSMLRTRQMLLANALALGSGMGMMSVSFLPSLIKPAFSVSLSTASFMLMPLVLSMMVGAPLAGRLLDMVGSKRVVVAGTAMVVVGMMLLAFASSTIESFYVACVFVGLGMSALLGAPIRYIVINAAPADDRASAQGSISVLTGVGQLLCSALIGSVAAHAGGGVTGFRVAYFLIGIITMGMLLVALGLKSRADEMYVATGTGQHETSQQPHT